MKHTVALMRGDGVGPEISEATLKVLESVQDTHGVSIDFKEVDGGDGCHSRTGTALPQSTVDVIRDCKVCLKGPVGETAADVIVRLRQVFDLYANIRPVKSYPNIPGSTPGVDLVFARENTEDVYKGIEFMLDGDTSVCLRVITREKSEKIARKGFELARARRKKVSVIHKANVMRVTDRLFLESCRRISEDYPEVEVEDIYVDAAAMYLIKKPHEFDVLITPNMFGDILSDEAAQVVGSLGLAPGANIGDEYALFEPVHGSAPKLSGKQIANPLSMILCSKMMLEWLGETRNDPPCTEAAESIERAVCETLLEGVKTPDLDGTARTLEVGLAVAKKIGGS